MLARPSIGLIVVLALCGPERADASPVDPAGPISPWVDLDLDGDGQLDPIELDYEGARRGFYRIAVRLSSTGRRLALPFDMEQGARRFEPFTQTGGGEPDQPVINLEIEMKAGQPLPIPRELRTRHGVRSHQIAVHLTDGRLRIENLKPAPHGHSAR